VRHLVSSDWQWRFALRILKTLVLVSVVLLVSYSAAALVAKTAVVRAPAAVVTPPAAAGDWVGTFHGAGLHGTVSLVTVQDGASCTFTGTAVDREGETVGLAGSFTFTGRKLLGTVDVSGAENETDPLKGRANRAGTHMIGLRAASEVARRPPA